MVVLNFKNIDQANAVVGVIDFSVGLIDEKEAKKVGKSIYELALSVKNEHICQQDENVLFLKEEEIEFVFGNAIWILEQEIKKKENQVFSNSIGLMKEILSIINKKKSNKFIEKGSRKFDPDLLEFYNENLLEEFLIIFDFEEDEITSFTFRPINNIPKKGDVYIVKKYIPFVGELKSGTVEDSLLIINKLTNKPFEINVSKFNKISQKINN